MIIIKETEGHPILGGIWIWIVEVALIRTILSLIGIVQLNQLMNIENLEFGNESKSGKNFNILHQLST